MNAPARLGQRLRHLLGLAIHLGGLAPLTSQLAHLG